jgi:hypothetical protein
MTPVVFGVTGQPGTVDGATAVWQTAVPELDGMPDELPTDGAADCPEPDEQAATRVATTAVATRVERERNRGRATRGKVTVMAPEG